MKLDELIESLKKHKVDFGNIDIVVENNNNQGNDLRDCNVVQVITVLSDGSKKVLIR